MRIFISNRRQSWCARNGANIRIGREIDCEARVFDDTTVSRYHCEVSFLNGLPIVEDTLSTHGTFVNGESIRSPTRLRDGDIIRVGFTEFDVEVIADSVVAGLLTQTAPE